MQARGADDLLRRRAGRDGLAGDRVRLRGAGALARQGGRPLARRDVHGARRRHARHADAGLREPAPRIERIARGRGVGCRPVGIDGVLVYVDDVAAHFARAREAGATLLSDRIRPRRQPPLSRRGPRGPPLDVHAAGDRFVRARRPDMRFEKSIDIEPRSSASGMCSPTSRRGRSASAVVFSGRSGLSRCGKISKSTNPRTPSPGRAGPDANTSPTAATSPGSRR